MRPYQKRLHAELMERAEYYVWAALRGQALPGNDPQTGRPKRALDHTHRSEGRVAYMALAKHTLERARRVRVNG